MFAPKSVTENANGISQSLKDEKLSVMRSALWNKDMGDNEANKIIEEFNGRWLAAGGISSAAISLRK